MDQILDPTSLRRAAPGIGLACGAAVALAIAVVPQWRLEAAVTASGLADLLSSARPPLGATARSALALAAGGIVASLVWAMLTFVRLPLRPAVTMEPDAPILRRADAHPDAPPRRPLRASAELGEPLPIAAIAPVADVSADGVGEQVSPRSVPADLDTPLAAIDPAAIPAVPREPVRAVAPLSRPALVDADDRMETFELTPIRRAAASPAQAPALQDSLSAMLDRLERSAGRRTTTPSRSLEETLGMLRGLAAR